MVFRSKTKKGKVSKAVKSYVHKAMKSEIEEKNSNMNAVAQVPSSLGVVYRGIDINQGDNIFDRTGDVISPVSYSARFRLIATTPAQIRLMLFCWRQAPDVTLPAIGILVTGVGAANTYAPISTSNNVSVQNGDFTVLYDKVVVLSVGSGLEKCIHMKVKPSKLPKKIHYNATTNLDYGKNMLFWAWVSNQPAAGNNITLDYYSAFHFRDA